MTLGPTTVLIVADLYPDPDLNTAFLRESRIRLLNGRDRGGETMDLVRRERPDLIIENLGTRGGTSSSFCSLLKTDPATRRTPLILVTEAACFEQAREAGADALLCKPLVPHAFFDAVRRFVPLPQRRQLRYSINLRFTFDWEGRTIQVFTRDISLTGAFLKTDRDLPEGAHLALTFALPGDPREIRCGGIVRRVHQPAERPGHGGVGIEFEGIRDADLCRLESHVQANQHRLSWFR